MRGGGELGSGGAKAGRVSSFVYISEFFLLQHFIEIEKVEKAVPAKETGSRKESLVMSPVKVIRSCNPFVSIVRDLFIIT